MSYLANTIKNKDNNPRSPKFILPMQVSTEVKSISTDLDFIFYLPEVFLTVGLRP